MLYLPEEHIEILSHNFDSDAEMQKMLDDSFLTQATKTDTVSFSIKILGYTDFVFINTQADTINIVIKNDSGEVLYEEEQILKDIEADSCESLFVAEPIWLDTGYIKLCDQYVGEATITLTPRDGYVKIGKFAYGLPVGIGAVDINMEYAYEDYLQISDDESDFESIDRFEIFSGRAFIKRNYLRFARQKLQKVVRKKRVWIDPFADKTFLYGILQSYRIPIEEEEGRVNLLVPVEMTIRGIV